jgi:hypothetical protein
LHHGFKFYQRSTGDGRTASLNLPQNSPRLQQQNQGRSYLQMYYAGQRRLDAAIRPPSILQAVSRPEFSHSQFWHFDASIFSFLSFNQRNPENQQHE